MPQVVHSTSWRYDEGRIVLTYVVFIDPPQHLPPYSVELVAIATVLVDWSAALKGYLPEPFQALS